MRKLSLAMMGLAIAGIMTMVSCRKPNVNNFNTTGEKITFSATIDNGSKTTLSEDIILWSIDDQISINGMTYTLASDPGETSGEFVGGDVKDVGGKYFASYPYSDTPEYENNGSSVKFNIPANTDNYNTLVGQIPMVAYTTTKSGGLGFKSMVNVLALNLVGTHSLTDIVVSSSEKLSGDFTVTVSDDPTNPGTPTTVTDGGTTRTIHFPDALKLDPSVAQRVNVVLPVFGIADSKISIKFIGADGVQIVGPMALSNSNTPNNRYYIGSGEVEQNLTVTLEPAFTVGPNSVDKVLFSRGNLYWNGSAFKFEANQWDYANTWNPSHVSHFYWSKTASITYGVDYDDVGAANTDIFFTNKGDDASKPNPDFTVENEKNVWRSLTFDEWNYLLGCDPKDGSQTGKYGRTNAMNLCGWQTVEKVPGLVILPDYSTKSLSSITTAAKLADAGAVFLPAAGYREDDTFEYLNEYGDYWSTKSTKKASSAYNMHFIQGNLYMTNYNRYRGLPVRLVR